MIDCRDFQTEIIVYHLIINWKKNENKDRIDRLRVYLISVQSSTEDDFRSLSKIEIKSQNIFIFAIDFHLRLLISISPFFSLSLYIFHQFSSVVILLKSSFNINQITVLMQQILVQQRFRNPLQHRIIINIYRLHYYVKIIHSVNQLQIVFIHVKTTFSNLHFIFSFLDLIQFHKIPRQLIVLIQLCICMNIIMKHHVQHQKQHIQHGFVCQVHWEISIKYVLLNNIIEL